MNGHTILGDLFEEAKTPLQMAAEELYKARLVQQNVDMNRNNTILREEAGRYCNNEYNENNRPAWIQNIINRIYRPRAGMGGTDVNKQAIGNIDRWIGQALATGYNLEDDDVVEAFGQVCLMEYTQGWVGKEPAGTTIGNYLGNWRGF